MKKIFASGQAYVALSRVKSLSGLIIKDFTEKAIYCNDSIKDAIKSMQPFLTENITHNIVTPYTFNVFLINIQKLTPHVSDLASTTP